MKKYDIKNVEDVVGFKCTICEIKFTQPTALGGHMSKMHPKTKATNGQMVD